MAFDGFDLVGSSVATVATAFAVEAFEVAVDMGRCSPVLAAQGTVLLTHCHSDHSAGLLAWLSARVRRHRGEPSRIVLPAERREDMLAALESWPDLEVVRRRIDLEALLVPAEAGAEVALSGGARARAFAVHHTAPTLGWSLHEAGRERPRITFAGDSTILPFRENPDLLDAEVAVVDCTFVEPGRRVAARLSGHTHLQDWLELAPDLPCDHLVFAHLPRDLRPDRFRELTDLEEKGSIVAFIEPG